jgi:NAD(P)-dependent dehydrogenase (short-subunit alcohol dehydrogenase family)
MLLTDQVAVISGGSRGIGYAIAHRFSCEGARVVIGARAGTRLKSAAARLNKAGPGALAVAGDLSTSRGCANLISRAVHWAGGIDILVNNVGSAPVGDFLSITDEQFLDAWRLKLLGAIRLIRGVIPSMKERGRGRIVNIIGPAGREPTGDALASGTTNAAMRALTRALAAELARQGIALNAISAGPVLTDRLRRIYRRRALSEGHSAIQGLEGLRAGMPTGRFIEPDEVAEVALLLATGKTPSLIGAEILLDGGKARSI